MNPLAQRGFARGAEAYAKARPSYPAEAVDWIAAQLGLASEVAVLDLGAGTGKLTAALGRFARVIAVEPVAEMRAQLAKLPAVQVLEGTAEQIPLADSAVDAVFVAQAFHWFATREALAEMHRVLRPGGGLALLWNRWDRSVAWADQLKAVTAPFDGLRPQHERGDWKAAFEGQPFFGPLETVRLENPQPLARADLLARMASTSTIAVLPADEQEALFARLRAVLDCHPDTVGRESVRVPYITEAFVAKRLGKS